MAKNKIDKTEDGFEAFESSISRTEQFIEKNQKYLTITESKKRFSEDRETFYYEKHKIFLYGEDFDKFKDGLQSAISFIEKEAEADNASLDINVGDTKISSNTDLSFEDLGNDNSKV